MTERTTSPTLVEATLLMARVVFPVLIVASLMIGAATLWATISPPHHVVVHRNASFEDLVIATQLERSHRIGKVPGKVNILIIGDSSTMMGIDAPKLQKRLGEHYAVESLATIAMAGPRAHMQLATNYAARNGPPDVLIFQMNPVTLSDEENGPHSFGTPYERWVLNDREPTPDWFERGRNKIFRDAISPLIHFPMRGTYAKQYGWPEDVTQFLNDNHGTMIDPGPVIPWDHNAHYFAVNFPYLLRLLNVAEPLKQLHASQVFIVFTPNIASKVSPEMLLTRAQAYQTVLHVLGQEYAPQLEIPVTLPDEDYISTHHLNAQGREEYTQVLADALKRQLPAILSARRANRPLPAFCFLPRPADRTDSRRAISR